MFILEFLLTIFYFLVIILIIAIVLAIAIPFGILFLVYWILFRSWKRSSKSKKIIVNKSKFNPKDIKNIISKAIKNRKSNVESEELENDIGEYIEKALESSNIEVENKDN
ncbi:MAG: hypothetical protein KAU02_01615 [Tenericutes bacterium]|nr:hypothetical protein [Mycoplasmatota bacterium]